MVIIGPVYDPQRHTGEITSLAQENGEPVYLTFHGAKHLVLIDAERFEELEYVATRANDKEARK